MISNYTATVTISLAVCLSSIGGAANAQEESGMLKLTLDHSTLLKGSASISSELVGFPTAARYKVWIFQRQPNATNPRGFAYYIKSFGPINTFPPNGTADANDVPEYWRDNLTVNAQTPSGGVTFDPELPFDVYISSSDPVKVKVTKNSGSVPVITIESRIAFTRKHFTSAQDNHQISVEWK